MAFNDESAKRALLHYNTTTTCITMMYVTVAPLAWVPWVPGNPSVFEQWVPEPITFETKK